MSPRKKTKKKTMLRITQVRSQIGSKAKNRSVLTGLGLGRIGRSVMRPNDDCIRGMINKVSHLVTVEEVEA